MPDWKNRIVGEGVKKASQFMAHPNNWRVHPQRQRDALRGALNEVGWVAPVLESKRSGYLIDGHERVWEALQNEDAEVPYVEVDLSEEEENYVLATLDPIAAMAQADQTALDGLLAEVKAQEEGILLLLRSLEGDSDALDNKAKPPVEFEEYSDDIPVDYHCPKCGYSWSGKPK